METLELISQIATIIAVPLALYVYLATKLREKRLFTSARVIEIYDAYHEMMKHNRKPEYHELKQFLGTVDRFANEYNEKLLCKKLAKQRIGDFMIRNYEGEWKEIIEQRRNQFKRQEYYSGIEKMIDDLRR